MKKSRLLLATLAVFTLSGCELPFGNKENKESEGGGGNTPAPAKVYDLEPEITGGSEEEKTAILEALNNRPICNLNGSSTSEIFPESTPILNEDKGDGIKVTTSQNIGEKTVSITWNVDETQEYFAAVLDSDAAHKIIEIKYKGYGNPDGEFKWSISKLECGEAKALNANIEYKAIVKNEEYKHDDYTIDELYAFDDNEKVVTVKGKEYKFPSTFNIVDYEDQGKSTYSPYFITNNPDAKEKQYLYVNVTGKVIYLAPDGNWGLLANGDDVLEFYAGSGTKLNAKNWPNLAKEYVTVVGNMGQYCGNVQLGFVTKIKEAKASDITEPSLTFRPIIEENIVQMRKEGYPADTQALKIDGVHMDGSLRQVTGTLVAGSLKDKDGNVVSDPTKLANNRFTFKLQVGAKTMAIAYDYHTDGNGEYGDSGLFSTLIDKLVAGGEMTIKGTARYAGNNSSPFYQTNDGVWNIVPFDVSHVA